MGASFPGGPLTGLRVVDLSSTFMGPYCTMLLAQWGADVVKVEPSAGDVVRYIGDHRRTGMGPVFLNSNRGKRSLVLDLKRPGAGRVLDPADRLVRRIGAQPAPRRGGASRAVRYGGAGPQR